MAQRQEHQSEERSIQQTPNRRTVQEEQEAGLTSPYLTLREAAAYARCSTRTIQRCIDAGKLARYGHGRRLLIMQAELEQHLSPATPKGQVTA